MDKYEYKVRVDAIKEMVGRSEYHEAVKIADSIDWRKCKSSMLLCSISDLYKVVKRYDDAKRLLLLAYEMRQGGKTVCYSLCEVCMKKGEYEQALGFYREFVQVAPRDPARLILQYKLYEMNGASLEDRIFILQELKGEDYKEKWGYELAYLYHKAGDITLCVQECDELALWFGAGKYVYKALELKQRYEPLTSAQQALYDSRHEAAGTKIYQKSAVEEAVASEETVNSGETVAESDSSEEQTEETYAPMHSETVPEQKEIEIEVRQIDFSPYSTINLQKEIAESLKAVMDQPTEIRSVMEEEDTARVEIDSIGEISEGVDTEEGNVDTFEEMSAPEDTETEADPVAEYSETEGTYRAGEEPMKELTIQETDTEETTGEDTPAELDMDEMVREIDNFSPERVVDELKNIALEREERVRTAQPPKEIAGSLSQESDGQIRLVVAKDEVVEKQITGQLSIEDVLKEWERLQRERELHQKEAVERLVSEHTGNLFAEFEKEQMDSLLERIENGGQTDSAEVQEGEELISYEALPEEDYGEVEELAEIEENENSALEETVSVEEANPATDSLIENTAPEEEQSAVEEESVEGDLGEAEDESEEQTVEESPEEEIDAEEDIPDEDSETQAEEQPMGEEDVETREAESVEKGEVRKAVGESFKSRPMTEEEKKMFEPFIQSRTGRDKLIHAIDAISMAPYTGNIIVTGDASMDTLAMAKTLIREVQQNDSNFSGRVAKITGRGLNNKDIADTFEKVKNGALIIQSACEMSEETVWKLYRALQQDRIGIIVALEDTKKNINELLRKYPDLVALFNARVDMEPLSNDSLVAHAKAYARSKEYSIDDLGALQLHNRIEQMQTIDHHVSTVDVRNLVDEAIDSADRKNLKHFFDILFGRRYDDEDMIILTEEDFE